MSWTINRGNENSLKSRFPGNVSRTGLGSSLINLQQFVFMEIHSRSQVMDKLLMDERPGL